VKFPLKLTHIFVAYALAALGPASTLGANDFPEPTPGSCVSFYNVNSTLDTDNDGIADHFRVIDTLRAVRGQTLNLVGIETSTGYSTAGFAQCVHIDYIHEGLDTSPYGDTPGVDLPVGYDYFFQAAMAWFDADSANRWGHVTRVEFIMGCPVGTRNNSSFTGPADEGIYLDSTYYRSSAAWFWTWAAPGASQNGYFDSRKTYLNSDNPYYTQVQATGNWEFIPNTLWIHIGVAGNPPRDSTKMWILCPTYLDGNTVEDVVNMISRSRHRIIQASGSARSDVWAVMDESSTDSDEDIDSAYTWRAPYRLITGFADSLQIMFPSRVLQDDDSSSIKGSDTVFVGWPGHVTIPSGDSVAVYFSAASKNYPCPELSEDWYSKIGFPIVPGAMTWGCVSFDMSTIRDRSLVPSGALEQPQLFEAIHQGFTYAVGHKFEPTSANLIKTKSIVTGLHVPHLDFAQLVSGSLPKTMLGQVPLGPAIGYFRQALAPANLPDPPWPFQGTCSEYISCNFIAPDDADSVLFTCITESGDTTITRVDTSPGGTVTRTIGSRWNSTALAKVLITIVDTENIHHTSQYIAP